MHCVLAQIKIIKTHEYFGHSVETEQVRSMIKSSAKKIILNPLKWKIQTTGQMITSGLIKRQCTNEIDII